MIMSHADPQHETIKANRVRYRIERPVFPGEPRTKFQEENCNFEQRSGDDWKVTPDKRTGDVIYEYWDDELFRITQMYKKKIYVTATEHTFREIWDFESRFYIPDDPYVSVAWQKWKEILPEKLYNGSWSNPTKVLPMQNELERVRNYNQYKYVPMHQMYDWGEYAEDYKGANDTNEVMQQLDLKGRKLSDLLIELKEI